MNTHILKLHARFISFVSIALAFLMVGCVDDPAGPSSGDNTSLASDATIYVSDEVSAQEGAEVRSNVRAHHTDSLNVQVGDLDSILQSHFADGEVLGIHLDLDRDSLDYEVVVRSQGRVFVVVVSSEDGSVKEKREISEYYYRGSVSVTVNIDVKVSIDSACDRARELVEGDVVEVNLEEIEGKRAYVIVLITPGNRYVTIVVSADSGREFKVKDKDWCRFDDDDDGDDDKIEDCDRHKNKRGRGHYRHGNGHGYGHYFHCPCKCDCHDDEDDDDGSDSVSVISQDSVRAIVSTSFAVDSSGILEITLDSATSVYETTVAKDSNRFDVRLDAETGAYISVEQTDGDMTGSEFTPPATDDATFVSLATARVAATAALAGTIESWMFHHSDVDNMWVYTFTMIETATSIEKNVIVSAETGLLLRIE